MAETAFQQHSQQQLKHNSTTDILRYLRIIKHHKIGVPDTRFRFIRPIVVGIREADAPYRAMLPRQDSTDSNQIFSSHTNHKIKSIPLEFEIHLTLYAGRVATAMWLTAAAATRTNCFDGELILLNVLKVSAGCCASLLIWNIACMCVCVSYNKNTSSVAMIPRRQKD